MQQDIVSVPVTANSSMAGPTPNVISINKPGVQNVVVTTQNIGSAQPSIIPNVQILNVRPGTAPVGAQKSVEAVSPRVVIGASQMVGARPNTPGITLQTLQSLQQGQQGHLLLKTENGQYQLLRVGPAPGVSNMTATQAQTIRLSTVPALSGLTTVSTSVVNPGAMGQIATGSVSSPVVASSVASSPTPQLQSQPQQQIQLPQSSLPHVIAPQLVPQTQAQLPPQTQPIVTTQKPLDNTKEKCRNFLANLLDLSSKEPMSVEASVRNLIQELIDAQVEAETFCERLERLLNASPQPCLIGFLKKSLPLLRQSLVTKELVIEGINPPSPQVAFSTIPPTVQPVLAATNITLPKPVAKPGGGTIAILQNIPVHPAKISVSKVDKCIVGDSKAGPSRPSTNNTALSTVLTPGKSLLKDKEKKIVIQPSTSSVDDKMGGDDDINDVAAMGGVNLAEESQRILGSTEMIGTQIRSVKDEFLTPIPTMQARLKANTEKHGLEDPSPDVAALVTHAVHERLKDIIEKLSTIAQHRTDHMIKTDPRYEATQDVKGQLKFLEELDRIEEKRREDSEREVLLRAAKSRSKTEDPEQVKLKAKAKEMQRAEMEEARQREANLTALQAIGPRKKPRPDVPGGSADMPSTSGTQPSSMAGRSQLSLRTRITARDMLFLMEQDKQTARSLLLYRSYLK